MIRNYFYKTKTPVQLDRRFLYVCMISLLQKTIGLSVF